jgi:hypothetical protein
MIAATPPARPSRPSIRLMAFVTPTIHSTAATGPTQPTSQVPPHGRLTASTVHPTCTSSTAARHSSPNFFHPAMSTKSSTTPVTNTSPTATGNASASVRPMVGKRCSHTARHPASVANPTPPITATPPMRGIGLTCTFRSPGTSSTCSACANRIIGPVRMFVINPATRAAKSPQSPSRIRSIRPLPTVPHGSCVARRGLHADRWRACSGPSVASRPVYLRAVRGGVSPNATGSPASPAALAARGKRGPALAGVPRQSSGCTTRPLLETARGSRWTAHGNQARAP